VIDDQFPDSISATSRKPGGLHMRWSIKLKLMVYAGFALFIGNISAGEYSPPGLYDVEHYVLDNGLRVMLKPRDSARSVAFRLVVGVGQNDYECGWQETPHFLEHLLFTGTSRHSETELDEVVEQHGGSWNAYTAAEDTVYKLDIYSHHADFGLEVLYEILSDSLLSAEDVEISRGIIEREAGGRPSAIEQWMLRHGVGRSATGKALRRIFPEGNYLCDELEAVTHISRDDILEAFSTYYVPGNMTLIVVGDFDIDEMRNAIVKSFGTLPEDLLPERPFRIPPPSDEFGEVEGTLEPLLGSDAEVGMVFRAVGKTSADFYTFYVLESYLDKRLYESIRVENGLAYSPASLFAARRDYGVFTVYADVDLEKQDQVLGLMRKEIERLHMPLHAETVEQTKRKLLLQMVQGYETNSGVADYYVGSVFEYETNGGLVDEEARIEAVTVDDLHRVATKYLPLSRAVVVHEVPTLTYARFYTILSILAIAVVVGIGYGLYGRYRR
jgi:predicted Zn-dependent peptidase